jgi:hypothetical protein
MKKNLRSQLVILTLLLASSGFSQHAQAKEITPPGWERKSSWRFDLGSEFPGAQGDYTTHLDGDKPVISLQYDFREGGEYVALVNEMPVEGRLEEIRFKIKLTPWTRVAVRVQDKNGVMFQFLLADLVPGEWQDCRVKLSDEPELAYFPDASSALGVPVEFPIKQTWICIQKNPERQGNVQLKGFKLFD